MGAQGMTLLGAALAAAAALSPAPAQAERVALVIGMSDYLHLRDLRNTHNDARSVASGLEAVGVEVTLSLDATQDELLATLGDFAFRAETADLALIYFSGHGVEVQGENFLIPVDAEVGSNQDIQRHSVSLGQLMGAVESARAMRLVILDACRENPFADLIDTRATPVGAAGAEVPTRSASGPSGLAPVDPERGTLVAYAAGPGRLAWDGGGDNSPYAEALVQAIGTPGLEIGLMFRQVRDDVLASTGNLQEPYTDGSLSATPFYLSQAASDEPLPVAETDIERAWGALAPDEIEQYAALAEEGNTRALLALYYLLSNPDDPRHDPALAVRHLERAVELGDPEAQFRLGRVLERGVLAEADPERALRLYEAAAAQDYAAAINELGWQTYYGRLGLVADTERALGHFRRAADLRFPEALWNYAQLIDDGAVAGMGPEEAGAYLYQALRSGNAQVLEQLGTTPRSFEDPTRRALQAELRDRGFYEGAIDGDFGPGTLAAIRAAFGLTG